jgi:hypothetical protein
MGSTSDKTPLHLTTGLLLHPNVHLHRCYPLRFLLLTSLLQQEVHAQKNQRTVHAGKQVHIGIDHGTGQRTNTRHGKHDREC